MAKIYDGFQADIDADDVIKPRKKPDVVMSDEHPYMLVTNIDKLKNRVAKLEIELRHHNKDIFDLKRKLDHLQVLFWSFIVIFIVLISIGIIG
ncbi:MAG: hypothetical protein LBH89_02905 [Lactococcus lactis]|jgi:hypothetical protein|nr:hypothetical protein [Lactococcus lactis]